MERTPRRGRRPKRLGDTRAAIRKAAGHLFANDGLDRTTLRAIAREAGVDPSLVLHYFGSKEQLFFEVVRESVAPQMDAAFDTRREVDGIGERIVGAFLTRWDAEDQGAMFSALFRAGLTNDRFGQLLREFIRSEIPRRLAPRLVDHRLEARVGLVATQLVGLGVARYVLRLAPVTGASREELTAAIGPTVTRYLSGPIDPKRA